MRLFFILCLASWCYAATPLPQYVVQSDTNRQEVVTELSEEESIKQAKNKKIAKGVVLGLGAAILLVLGAVVVAFIVVVVLFLKLIFSLGSARSKRQKK